MPKPKPSVPDTALRISNILEEFSYDDKINILRMVQITFKVDIFSNQKEPRP